VKLAPLPEILQKRARHPAVSSKTRYDTTRSALLVYRVIAKHSQFIYGFVSYQAALYQMLFDRRHQNFAVCNGGRK
jgi:hypothetical protein